jgi:hypothetical protein
MADWPVVQNYKVMEPEGGKLKVQANKKERPPAGGAGGLSGA